VADPIASLVKGTLDLLVLRTLELQPLHGAAIAERIFQTTRDISNQGRIVVPRPSSPGTGRMDRGGVGNAAEGPPHQVLPPDP
jgi:hypothetical protein